MYNNKGTKFFQDIISVVTHGPTEYTKVNTPHTHMVPFILKINPNLVQTCPEPLPETALQDRPIILVPEK